MEGAVRAQKERPLAGPRKVSAVQNIGRNANMYDYTAATADVKGRRLTKTEKGDIVLEFLCGRFDDALHGRPTPMWSVVEPSRIEGKWFVRATVEEVMAGTGLSERMARDGLVGLVEDGLVRDAHVYAACDFRYVEEEAARELGASNVGMWWSFEGDARWISECEPFPETWELANLAWGEGEYSMPGFRYVEYADCRRKRGARNRSSETHLTFGSGKVKSLNGNYIGVCNDTEHTEKKYGNYNTPEAETDPRGTSTGSGGQEDQQGARSARTTGDDENMSLRDWGMQNPTAELERLRMENAELRKSLEMCGRQMEADRKMNEVGGRTVSKKGKSRKLDMSKAKTPWEAASMMYVALGYCIAEMMGDGTTLDEALEYAVRKLVSMGVDDPKSLVDDLFRRCGTSFEDRCELLARANSPSEPVRQKEKRNRRSKFEEVHRRSLEVLPKSVSDEEKEIGAYVYGEVVNSLWPVDGYMANNVEQLHISTVYIADTLRALSKWLGMPARRAADFIVESVVEMDVNDSSNELYKRNGWRFANMNSNYMKKTPSYLFLDFLKACVKVEGAGRDRYITYMSTYVAEGKIAA